MLSNTYHGTNKDKRGHRRFPKHESQESESDSKDLNFLDQL